MHQSIACAIFEKFVFEQLVDCGSRSDMISATIREWEKGVILGIFLKTFLVKFFKASTEWRTGSLSVVSVGLQGRGIFLNGEDKNPHGGIVSIRRGACIASTRSNNMSSMAEE